MVKAGSSSQASGLKPKPSPCQSIDGFIGAVKISRTEDDTLFISGNGFDF